MKRNNRVRFENYDRRKYRTLSVEQGYRLWSESYDRFMAPFQLDLPLLARCNAVKLRGVRSALDLGCGTGRMGSWLKGRGVKAVDGMDASAAMLAHARQKGIYRRIWLRRFPPAGLPAASYDLVMSSLALCHLPDPGGFYRDACRVTRRNGGMIVIDYHPHFLLNGIPTHFQDSKGRTFGIRNYVHLFRDHFAHAAKAGWRLIWLDELVVQPGWARRHRGWRPYVHQPVSFMMCWRKK